MAEHYQDLLRHLITSGRLQLGQRLAPAALAAEHHTSTTVIRDALMRLVAERMVVLKPNRGFFVPELSIDELQDLTLVRIESDSLALRLSIERGTLSWETSLVAAHHMLTKAVRRSDSDPSHQSEEWSRAHRAFHLQLVAACGVSLLRDMTAILFDSVELYRCWAAPSPAATHRDVAGEHAAVLAATLDRDSATAIAVLTAHYRTTLDIVRTSGLITNRPR